MAQEESPPKQQFSLERLYVKEKHFKSQQMPAIFREEWKPEISIEMQIKNEAVEGQFASQKPTEKSTATNPEAALKPNENQPTSSQPESAPQKDYYEVVLQLSVTAKQNQMTVLTMEAQQAGIFVLAGFPEEVRKQILTAHCPNILFPYARKVISDMTVEASLPPLLLNPIDFVAIYQEQQRREEQDQQNKQEKSTGEEGKQTK